MLAALAALVALVPISRVEGKYRLRPGNAVWILVIVEAASITVRNVARFRRS